jgi:hypothetical protein
LGKVADVSVPALSSIARNALEAHKVPDYKKKKEEAGNEKQFLSPPAWVIVTFALLLVFFNILPEDIKFPDNLYIIVFALLILGGLFRLAQYLSDKRADKLIQEAEKLFQKGLESKKEFANTNLLEYSDNSVLQSISLLQSSRDNKYKREISEWAPLIIKKLVYGYEPESFDEIPDIVKISNIKGVMFEPEMPLSKRAKVLMEFYSEPSIEDSNADNSVSLKEKESQQEISKKKGVSDFKLGNGEEEQSVTCSEKKLEYMMYSHDFPNGKKITAKECQKRRDDFDPANENHLFCIYPKKEEFFNKGNPNSLPPRALIILRELILNLNKTVRYTYLYEQLTKDTFQQEVTMDTLKNRCHEAKRVLNLRTFKKIDKYISYERGEGYIFLITEDVHFCFIENID